MKKLFLSLLALLALSTGCSMLKRTAVEIVPARTNIVQVVTTNIVQREVWTTNTVQVATQRTNELGVVLPPVWHLQPVRDLVSTQVLQTNLQTIVLPPVYYTNLALSDSMTGAIHTAGDLAPVPWGGLAGQALTGLAGIVFGVVNLLGRRKAIKAAGEAQQNANDFKRAAEVVVQNVEAVRQAALKTPGYTPALDRNVMRGIQAVQKAADVVHIIAPIVEEHTGSTKADAMHESANG